MEAAVEPGLGPFTLDELREHEQRLLSDWVNSFPKMGEGMFLPSFSGAYVDPLGLTDPSRPGERPLFGRWWLYTQGFLEAGDRLVDSLRPAEMAIPAGAALLYPILFCYRHYLELRLKGLIFSIRQWQSVFSDIGQNLSAKKEERLSKTYSLKDLWEIAQSLNSGCDCWASDETRKAFEALLFELDAQDPNGEAGRYPEYRNGDQTLARLENVDLGALKITISKVSRYLEETERHFSQEMAVRGKMVSGELEDESFDHQY